MGSRLDMICIECKVDKKEKSFIPGKMLANGIRSRSKICRACKRRRLHESGKCSCGRPLVTKTRCRVCIEKSRVLTKRRAARLKAQALNHYGWSCVFCGESYELFLTIDHINDDGAVHRRSEKISTGSKTYRWLEKQGYPDGFQVACFNCNAAKARIGSEKLKGFWEKRRRI